MYMTGECCHAPHGACELKSERRMHNGRQKGHAPHGACELKCLSLYSGGGYGGHAPHGACELKCSERGYPCFSLCVTPRMGRVS